MCKDLVLLADAIAHSWQPILSSLASDNGSEAAEVSHLSPGV